MQLTEIVDLVARVEQAGQVAELERDFAFELNAIENGDEGLVAADRLEQLATAAKALLGEKRRYFVTEITLQVLSEDEPVPSNMDIAQVAEEMTDGDFSGMEIKRDVREVSPAEMAAALRAQGSDPEFFRLSDDGTELDY